MAKRSRATQCTRIQRGAIVAEYEKSGLSVREFAEAKNIKISTLYAWINEKNQHKTKCHLDRPRFVEISVTEAEQASSSVGIRKNPSTCCVRVGQAEIEWSSLPDPQWLAQLLKSI